MSLPLESTPNTTMVIPATQVVSVPLLSPTTTTTLSSSSSSTMVMGASTTVAATTSSSSSASGTLLPPRRVSFRDSEIGDVVKKVTFDAEPAIQEYVCEHDHQYEEEQPQDDEVNDNDSVALLTHHANRPLHLSSSESSESNNTRGLELKHSPSRQTRKFTILKSLIKNQSKCSAEQLGKLARRCNAWAREAARVQGLMDYQDAYRLPHDNTTTTFDAASNQQLQLQWPAMEQFPLPLKQKSATGSTCGKKRAATASSSSSSSSEEEQRRVRARVL